MPPRTTPPRPPPPTHTPPHPPRQEFIRVGYYVNNEYTEEQLRDDPPHAPLVDRRVRVCAGAVGALRGCGGCCSRLPAWECDVYVCVCCVPPVFVFLGVGMCALNSVHALRRTAPACPADRPPTLPPTHFTHIAG